MDTDPVVYTVTVQHWQDGDVECQVQDVGDSDADRAAVAYALRRAADMIEHGTPLSSTMFS